MAPAFIAKDASETWSLLVQFWRGQNLDVGEDYLSDSEVPVPALPGEKVRMHTTIRVERGLPCPNGGGTCVEARMRSTPDPQDVARMAKRLVGDLGLPVAQVEQAVGEMSADMEAVLVAEPGRLVPHRLEKTRMMSVRPGPGAPEDAKPIEGKDVTVWIFTYAAAAPR